MSPAPIAYRCKWLITMAEGPSKPISDAAFIVADQRITHLGKWQDLKNTAAFRSVQKTVDLGEQIVLPGLINAHCHLDYTMMRGAIAPQKSFTEWLKKIIFQKNLYSLEDYTNAIEQGWQELRNSGTTTVFNMEAYPKLLSDLSPPPLRIWWFYELIDILKSVDLDKVVSEAQALFQTHPALGYFGLNPHSPYSASAPLFKEAQTFAQRFHLPITTHLCESEEEHQLFTSHLGPLYKFFTGFGHSFPHFQKGRSPLEELYLAGAIHPQWIVAHLNYPTQKDLELLSVGGPLHGLNVVHCPLCHRYFNRPPFPFHELRERGVNLCVGTDSLASNDSLNLLAELRELKRALSMPSVTDFELLKMITVNPAKAIGWPGKIGQLITGAYADFIAIPAPSDCELNASQTYEIIIDFPDPIEVVYVAGIQR